MSQDPRGDWAGSSPRVGYAYLSRRRSGSSPSRSTSSSPLPTRSGLHRSESFNRGAGFYSGGSEDEADGSRGTGGGSQGEYPGSMLGRSRLLFPQRRWSKILNLDLWRASQFGMEVSPQDERTYRLVR